MFLVRNFIALSLAASFNLLAQPSVLAVVNAASFQSGLPAGGALATAYVTGLTALTAGTYLAPPSQPLPYKLGGITVTIDNDYAPLLAVVVSSDPMAAAQVNFQVPLSANASLLYQYVQAGPTYLGGFVVSDGVNKAMPTTTLTTSGLPDWGGFFSGVNGYAIAVHTSDSTPVTSENPAQAGEPIIAYADGFFTTWPRPLIGLPTPPQVNFQPDYSLIASPGYLYLQSYPQAGCPPAAGQCPGTGSITNTPALKVTFMGLATGVVGVEAIGFVVPSNQQTGNWALFFNQGSCPDGSGIPGTCGATFGSSSPFVLLPVRPEAHSSGQPDVELRE